MIRLEESVANHNLFDVKDKKNILTPRKIRIRRGESVLVREVGGLLETAGTMIGPKRQTLFLLLTHIQHSLNDRLHHLKSLCVPILQLPSTPRC